MKWPLLSLVALSLSQMAFSCHDRQQELPTNYDQLAHASGHWEWVRSVQGFAGVRTPASVGFTRQLRFGADGELLMRHVGIGDYRVAYQLYSGRPQPCGTTADVPLVVFMNERTLPNDDVKTYDVREVNGRRELTLTGGSTCLDGGATEHYYWVPE